MHALIRPYASSGITLLLVGAFLAGPTPPDPDPLAPRRDVALAAQVRPVVAISVPGAQDITAPIAAQIAFHVDLVVDFVVDGAKLVGRQTPVPGRLLRDIAEGRSLPVAVTRALTTLAEVELDAGRQLIGFGTRYVDFQLRFVADVVQGAVVVAAAVPVAVTEFVTTAVADVVPTRSMAATETASLSRHDNTPEPPDDVVIQRNSLKTDAADAGVDDEFGSDGAEDAGQDEQGPAADDVTTTEVTSDAVAEQSESSDGTQEASADAAEHAADSATQ
jgi:hypothetical protein